MFFTVMFKRVCPLLVVLVLVCSSFLLAPPSVYAATFTVTTGDDSGPGSLRQAISDANATPAADTIVFDGVSTITLTSGQITISADLSIEGGDGVTIQRTSDNLFRLFEIPTDTVVTINNATLTGGGNGLGGGAFRNRGTLRVIGCTFVGNDVPDSGEGGAIRNDGGTVLVLNSTFANNRSRAGGALSNVGGGTVTLVNSTVAQNEAVELGSGLYNFDSTMTVANTIVADNLIRGTPNGDLANLGSGTLNTLGGNIIESGVNSSDTVLTADPELGALQDNGGAIQTFVPAASSPAINGGSNAIVDGTAPPADVNGDGEINTQDTLTTDQRGLGRIFAETVDIGAVETDVTPPTPELVYLPVVIK